MKFFSLLGFLYLGLAYFLYQKHRARVLSIFLCGFCCYFIFSQMAIEWFFPTSSLLTGFNYYTSDRTVLVWAYTIIPLFTLCGYALAPRIGHDFRIREWNVDSLSLGSFPCLLLYAMPQFFEGSFLKIPVLILVNIATLLFIAQTRRKSWKSQIVVTVFLGLVASFRFLFSGSLDGFFLFTQVAILLAFLMREKRFLVMAVLVGLVAIVFQPAKARFRGELEVMPSNASFSERLEAFYLASKEQLYIDANYKQALSTANPLENISSGFLKKELADIAGRDSRFFHLLLFNSPEQLREAIDILFYEKLSPQTFYLWEIQKLVKSQFPKKRRIKSSFHLLDTINTRSEPSLVWAQWLLKGSARFGDESLQHTLLLTPTKVAFWDGETYEGIVSGFIPGFLLKKKMARHWNEFGRRYRILEPWDLKTSVAYNIFAEAYMNYGWLWLGCVSLLFGIALKIPAFMAEIFTPFPRHIVKGLFLITITNFALPAVEMLRGMYLSVLFLIGLKYACKLGGAIFKRSGLLATALRS